MSVEKIQNYIGGELVDPNSGDWLDNYEPATGQVYSQVPDSNAADIEAAVVAAESAKDGWADMPVDERSEILFRLADAVDEHREELVQLESRDNGKPEWLARSVDIPRSSKNIRHFASTVIGKGSESHLSLIHI